MKKLLFTAAIAVIGFTNVNAQNDNDQTTGFAKGDIFISGSVGFGSEKIADDKANVFEIAPQAGFFVTENIAVGAKLGYISRKAESGPVDTVDMGTLSAGVFGRYYFTPDSQFSVFGELGVDYRSTDDKLADVKTDGFAVGVAPGVSYFISKSFALEASFGILGYTTEKADFDGAESYDTLSFGLNLRDINFGLVYKF
ncbi:outer membrane beta-barrel protein [Bizionia hallyeonensis]|uniref:Outer membrane beta-barrel protein n=1 Tax=Bizionia hallyeonensis TaxID=1123757 RepID=A0ABW0C759_9FLAO